MASQRTFNTLEEVPELLISISTELGDNVAVHTLNERRAEGEGRTWLYDKRSSPASATT
jgi:hypothetical protein